MCSFLFFLFLPCFFYLNTTETHANTHSYFKGLYFFPCSCWSGPPSHNPCFKLFWVWIYYGARECVCQCLYNVCVCVGGVLFLYLRTLLVIVVINFFYFFIFFCLELNLGTERMERLAFGKKYWLSFILSGML